MFLRVEGSTRKELPQLVAKRASVAMNVGDVVITTSGQVDVAVAASKPLFGLAIKKVSASDSDYASNTAVAVEAIDPNAVYLADVGTGTLTTAMIGNQYDLKDASSIDVTGTTYKQVTIVGYMSATQALVKFSPTAF